jgi:hypothetical protein
MANRIEESVSGERGEARWPRYVLDELLAQCDPEVSRDEEEREWLGGSFMGSEI